MANSSRMTLMPPSTLVWSKQAPSRNLETENEGKSTRSYVPTSLLSVTYNYPKSLRVLQLLHFKKEVKTETS